MLRDEGAHEGLALWIVHIHELHTGAREEIFSALEVGVLADDHGRDFEEQRRPGTHHAWTQCAHQYQPIPVPPSAGIADADDLSVCRRVACLDTQVMSGGNDLAIRIREHRSNRQSTFLQTFPRLIDCCEKKLVLVHFQFTIAA